MTSAAADTRRLVSTMTRAHAIDAVKARAKL